MPSPNLTFGSMEWSKSENKFFTHLDCTCAKAHRWELKDEKNVI